MPDNRKLTKNFLICLIATLWLTIALIGYYYTHKPFTVELIVSAMIILWRLLVTAGIISLSGGIGSWTLSKKTSFPPLTSLALQAAIGAGVLGLIVLLIGVTIGFSLINLITHVTQ